MLRSLHPKAKVPLLFALSALLAFLNLGGFYFFDVEASFAQATKEMMERGDLLTPSVNGEKRFDKPILFYWLMFVCYKLFGVSEFSARLPSAVSGFALSICLFLFLRRIHREQLGFLSCLFFTFSFYFVSFTHAAVVDMTLTLFVCLSLFCFFLFARGERHFLYGFYLFSALAFLTKGLVGILIPFCVVLIYSFLSDGTRLLKGALDIKGVCLFLLVSLPWVLVELLLNGMDFFYEFIVRHHFVRYARVISGHRGPFYFYIPLVLVGFFPWIIFLPRGLKKVLRGDVEQFAFVWALFVFLFFSFSKTKFPSYILPMLPPLAMIAASGSENGKPSYMFLCILSIVLCLLALVSPSFFPMQLSTVQRFLLYALSIWFGLFFAVGLFAHLKGADSLVLPLSVLMFLFLTFTSLALIPHVNAHVQGEITRFSLYAKERTVKGEEVVAFGTNNPAIIFYSERKVRKFKDREGLKRFVEGKDRVFIVAHTDYAQTLKELGLSAVEEGRGYVLFVKE